MMGHRSKRFKLFTETNLEALVPADNFYRRLEERLDLSFVRDLVRDRYEEMGSPSIDPVVFFKLNLIAFFDGITWERRLMETAQLNLADRWYLGYDLDEALPDHSSLSKIRSRYGLEAFHGFFERIVEMCIEAGLVEGEGLYLDATKVESTPCVRASQSSPPGSMWRRYSLRIRLPRSPSRPLPKRLRLLLDLTCKGLLNRQRHPSLNDKTNPRPSSLWWKPTVTAAAANSGRAATSGVRTPATTPAILTPLL